MVFLGLPNGVFGAPSISSVMAMCSEAVRCQYEIACEVFHYDRHGNLWSAIRDQVGLLVEWHNGLCSWYLDILGELTTAQFACTGLGGKRKVPSSPSGEDGEDEFVAQEVDLESDGDAEMIR